MAARLSRGARRFLMRGRRRRRLLALDTMCFVYRFEANPGFLSETRDLLSLIEAGACQGAVSVLAVTEALTVPLRQGAGEIAATYEGVFTSFPNLALVPVDLDVAKTAAALRARHGLRTPDAIHVACALRVRADAFVTADQRLARLPEIEVLLLQDRR